MCIPNDHLRLAANTEQARTVIGNPSAKLRVIILWTQWAGYMDYCAKELQRLLSCELDIVYFANADQAAPYAESEFFSYPCKHLEFSSRSLEQIQRQRYDIMLICGWHVREYRQLANLNRGRSIRLLCMDNQWVASVRQYLGIVGFRLLLRRYYDFAFVPGSRQALFASYLGFSAREIIEGHYSCSDEFAQSVRVGRSRSFLFVGRLVAEKGIHELADAWSMYVRHHTDPWSLKVCGEGPLSERLSKLPSTEILGFVQPSQLPDVMARASALVLPSIREPWGVVVHEAARAGLGLIVTSACGSADYFLRNGFNGRLVPPADAGAVCEALEWFHQLDNAGLEQVSQRSTMLSAQRSALSWACSASRVLALGRAA